jgi:metal-dependent amidase/aminoacylase/carboxypeptidase family protein
MEVRTAGIMAAQLTALGYDVTTGVGGTGVVAVLRNGDGPTVMIRADMDGLPLAEAVGRGQSLHRGSGRQRRRREARHARLRPRCAHHRPDRHGAPDDGAAAGLGRHPRP